MRNRIYFLPFVFFFSFNFNHLIAQSFREETDFIHYLFSIKEYDEASIFVENISTKYTAISQLDSINFYLGKANYELKRLEESISSFQKVGTGSYFYPQSQFFAGFQLAYVGKLDSAEAVFDRINSTDSLIEAAKTIEQAGVSLLKRDYESFGRFSTRFDGKFYQLKSSEDGLNRYEGDLRSFNAKSPFLAGLFSTIIPGSGKIYAGKTGQGIGNILVSGLFALGAIEGYRKDGPKSARFIVFGSIFSIFYIGNIYGSVFAVKIRRDEFNEKINNAIMVDMHLPIRFLFR